MENYLDYINLVDLISDKHAKLRKKVIEAWEENEEERITETESYIIALVQKDRMTVAQIAKKIGISRQGIHKCTKNLIERGYIEIEEGKARSREKYLRLTEKGIYFVDETLKIKKSIENEIIKSIGQQKFDFIKEIFNSSWFN